MPWVAGVIGAVLIAVGFYAQARTNKHNAVGAFLGREAEGSAVPWVLGVLGAIMVLAAVAMVVQVNRPAVNSRIPMGWHDDPHDPSRLRYHNGSDWTERTADKK